ncbi:ProQ/FINO family protein [Halomonas vilamensis]|uniref:ProQ/FINO family protein n=1 Tax=Vreelandella vilamensis TaxID=531309 RepID=A0ABU1H5N7_9GAMM|nr:ProQ/FINO family protein [Halomonas vilamensis]MDR5899617.1 ProQ/FINO family protein [Halomonas vilamensis]
MAARVIQLLDDLEARLAHAQREINALREENQRLKQTLGEQSAEDEAQTAVHAPSTPLTADTPAAEKTMEANEEGAKGEGAESVESLASVASAKPPSPHELLQQWYERYPNAFFKGHTKPLKVGIHQDLAECEPWSNKLIRRALANYVNLPRYAKAMREGAERIDLQGNAAGVVDPQAAQFAAQKRQHNAPADKKVAQNAPQPALKGKQKNGDKRAKNVQKPRQVPQKSAAKQEKQPVEKRALTMEEKLASLQAKFERL